LRSSMRSLIVLNGITCTFLGVHIIEEQAKGGADVHPPVEGKVVGELSGWTREPDSLQGR